MTLVDGAGAPGAPGPHVGELRLRRFRIGELGGDEREEVARHTGACGTCRARLSGLDDEQRGFEREIPFPRFAGGVERARRVPRARPRSVWMAGVASFAAAAALVLIARSSLFRQGDAPAPTAALAPAAGGNNLKGGGTEAGIRIAGGDGASQRDATRAGVERLARGERLRIGYRTDAPRHLVALAVADDGDVTPLYPEADESLFVAPTAALAYLPDSIELVGAGHERVFLLLGDRPFTVEQAMAVARAAHARARGDLAALTPLAIEGVRVEVFSWLFEKP